MRRARGPDHGGAIASLHADQGMRVRALDVDQVTWPTHMPLRTLAEFRGVDEHALLTAPLPWEESFFRPRLPRGYRAHSLAREDRSVLRMRVTVSLPLVWWRSFSRPRI